MRLVFFDLDGTITRHDTLVPYVFGFLRRNPKRWWRLLGTVPALLGFVLGLADHGKVKASLMKHALGRCTRTEIDNWTEEFVRHLLAHGVFREALERIDAHRRAGDVLVLMSASPDLYVPAIGRALGFTETVCTGVRWNGDRLLGTLGTANRRGPEKARCFAEVRARYPDIATVAYANGPSDFDHLILADEPVLVNALAPLRRKARLAGIPCVDWN